MLPLVCSAGKIPLCQNNPWQALFLPLTIRGGYAMQERLGVFDRRGETLSTEPRAGESQPGLWQWFLELLKAGVDVHLLCAHPLKNTS